MKFYQAKPPVTAGGFFMECLPGLYRINNFKSNKVYFCGMLKQHIQKAGKYVGFALFFLMINISAIAQCSICTRTAQQLGEGPAKDLNVGIIYLAFTPLIIFSYLGYRWYKSEK